MVVSVFAGVLSAMTTALETSTEANVVLSPDQLAAIFGGVMFPCLLALNYVPGESNISKAAAVAIALTAFAFPRYLVLGVYLHHRSPAEAVLKASTVSVLSGMFAFLAFTCLASWLRRSS